MTSASKKPRLQYANDLRGTKLNLVLMGPLEICIQHKTLNWTLLPLILEIFMQILEFFNQMDTSDNRDLLISKDYQKRIHSSINNSYVPSINEKLIHCKMQTRLDRICNMALYWTHLNNAVARL